MQGQILIKDGEWCVYDTVPPFSNPRIKLHPKYTTEYLGLRFIKNGDIVEYNTTTIYIEPDNSIHCNRGSDVPVANIVFLPYLVNDLTYGYSGVYVAPTKDSVCSYINSLNTSAEFRGYIELINSLIVKSDIDIVSKLV